MLARFADARVLVIDDVASNVTLLDKLLRQAGLHAVQAATDPREALERLDDLDPDLILLDLHMPGLDGYGVLQRLAERAGGSYLPVMVLTADARPEATQRALDAGARDFLAKPFDAVEVVLRVRNLLETRYLHLALRNHNHQLRTELGVYQEVERAERDERERQHDRIERVIRDGEIEMVYQPVLDLGSGEVVGVEALARFPADSLRGPDRWFLEAGRVGLGAELELAAIRAALPALEVLPAATFLAVNASPATFLTPELAALCRPYATSRLVVELTEHVPVEDYEAINAAASMLREDGVRIAADDAGAGYAGFRHLLSIKPDIIKLDISLIRDIDRDAGRRALATALVHFTADTGARLIAEGIETEEELRTLRKLHVEWGQGYHLGRPKPLVDHGR